MFFRLSSKSTNEHSFCMYYDYDVCGFTNFDT